MNADVWSFYAKEVLCYEVDRRAVLLVDIFENHVSDEERKAIAEVVARPTRHCL